MKILRKFRAGRAATDDVTVSRADATFLNIAACIADRIPKTNDLLSRLDMLATAAVGLPGIAGVLVAACTEDGRPLRHRDDSLSIRNGKKPLIALRDLTAAVSKSNRWVELTAEQCSLFEMSEGDCLTARRILDEDGAVGLIVVKKREVRGTEILEDLEKALPCIAWIIRDSFRLEQTRRIEALRRLELEGLGLTKRIDTKEIAKHLQKIFRATTATILWREQERLYLSATTDRRIAEKSVVYDAEMGIAGYILETGKSILFRDATDPEETREKLGRRLEKSEGVVAQYPEALAESGDQFQVLAVPMHKPQEHLPPDQTEAEEDAAEALGIIRLLREGSDPPFTAVECEDLQHFANLLGLAMLSAWRWIETHHILKAETEAICITRNDFEKDSDGHAVPRMVYCDPGGERLFGMSDEELRGKDARELYDDGEYEKIRKGLKGALAERKTEYGPIKAKVRRSTLEGEETRSAEISYRLLTNPFFDPPAPYAIAVIRDVTERHHLVELLDSKGLAYFRADREGRTLETSDAESSLTGYSVVELEGKLREELYFNRSDRSKLMARVRKADGKFVYARERLKRKGGEAWFLAEGVVRLVKDRKGKEAGTEGLYEDVTDRRRLQGFLDVQPGKLLREHELYSKLEENARFQLLFMTSLSHQLRSPLGALIGHLDNFSRGVTDASRFSNHLKYCIGQARTCGQLVTNLTYMDKMLRGEPFKFKRINLTRLVIETKIDYESLARERWIRFEVDDSEIDRLLPDVWGHGGLLVQVLVNLFDNAIKYSVPRTVVSVRAAEDVGRNYLQISNEGLRVPREDRDKIFEQGVRLPKAKAWVSDGSGLGLWLVRKILNVHGAKIRCVDIYEFGKNRTAFQIFFLSGPIRGSLDSRRVS